MKFSDIELPSNRKFGLFFAGVFAAASAYFFNDGLSVVAWLLAGLAIVFSVLAVTLPVLLLPLNKLWMRFGFLLGMIVSPIVLGLIFFVIFTPIGLLMRLFGRDELHLKDESSVSYWKVREPSGPSGQRFKQQF